MADVSTLPLKSASEPPVDVDLHMIRAIRAKQRPAARRAFGFLLGPEVIRRWALWAYESEHGHKLSTVTPEEAAEEVEDWEFISSTVIPSVVYNAFPTLPRLRNRLMPVVDGDEHYLFVLRDNAPGGNVPLYPEHFKALRALLGLSEDEQPDWYRIA